VISLGTFRSAVPGQTDQRHEAAGQTSAHAADRVFALPVLAVGGEIYSGLVLDLSSLDLEQIGNALSDQTDYEHRWTSAGSTLNGSRLPDSSVASTWR